MKKIFGNIINPLNKDKTEIIKNGCILINDEGIIEKKGDKQDFKRIKCSEDDYGSAFIIPGFIDTHTHIPQYPMIGRGRGELLEWLENYIFPAELKFSEIINVKNVFEDFSEKSVKFGTTTSVAFSSSHLEALQFIIRRNNKLRLFAGNSLMDMGDNKLADTTNNNLSKLKEMYNHSKSRENFQYIVSPRYAGNCTFELLKKSADFAKENNLYMQTHLSENKDEIDYIMNLHNSFENYTDIYDKAGILNSRSILAHCIHLSEKELEIIYNYGAIISHCPTSNIFLKSGIMPLKKYLDTGMKITLGTDVAAGYTLDMKTELRNAIESSKILSYFSQNDCLVRPAEIFPHSNILAAEYLNIAEITGNLNPGKYADITVIANPENVSDGLDDMLNCIIYNEEKSNLATYYKGKRVF